MQQFEIKYVELIQEILQDGQLREGRNGNTRSVFGRTLDIDMSDNNKFPLLTGRRMYPDGVFGEFAALVRGPHHVDDFKAFNCNYWDLWADEQGYLNVDYGNAWKNFGGIDQMAQLKDKLINNPSDRRMIITGWNPVGMEGLSLPCCHLLYQWYVRDGIYLDMIWYQRSCDTMIGLPSDIILAATWNIMLANEVNLSPGNIKMVFGDTHIYEEHFDTAQDYCARVLFGEKKTAMPRYEVLPTVGTPVEEFLPGMIKLKDYSPYPPIKFELKS